VHNVSSKAFFSRAFDSRVSEFVDCINKVASALNVETYHVDSASPKTPPKEAQKLIQNSDFLIALCTKSEKIEGCDEYTMSTAVREEIVVANTAEIPVLCFVEDKVRTDGFLGNRLTYEIIDNGELPSLDDIQRIVKGIYETKLSSLRFSQNISTAGLVSDFFYENIRMRIELLDLQEGYCWDYVIEKSLKFTGNDVQPLQHCAWAAASSADSDDPPIYNLEFLLNGRPVSPTLEEKIQKNSINVRSVFEPPLKKDDNLFVREKFRSPFLSPVHSNQMASHDISVLGDNYDIYDGLCVVQRIEQLSIEFVFPENYPISRVSPVVSTFSDTLDQIHERELNRLKQDGHFNVASFNSKRTYSIEIERPFYQYLYGIAWCLPAESELPLKLAESAVPWD